MRKRLGCLIPAVILLIIAVCIAGVILVGMYHPQNRQARIEDISNRLRAEIESQAETKYGEKWQDQVSIKDITVQEIPWYVIDPKDWTFIVSFEGSLEEKTYRTANYKQRAATGLGFCEVSNDRYSTIDLSVESFPLIPDLSVFDIHEYVFFWIGETSIKLTDDQEVALIEVLRGYSAEKTDEIAFNSNDSFASHFIIRFYDSRDQNRIYSLGVCIGRDGTEDCFAVSACSNNRYAKISNGEELCEVVIKLLESWGLN